MQPQQLLRHILLQLNVDMPVCRAHLNVIIYFHLNNMQNLKYDVVVDSKHMLIQ